MPLYEYECTSCHRRTEKIQKFSDAELTVCPYCGGKLERTITAAAASFKGGGWFKDGYGSVKPAAASGGEASGGEKTPAVSGDKAVPAATSGSAGASESAAPASPAPAAAPAAAPPSKT